MRKNDEFILTVTDYTTEGSGVAKYDGMAVFIPATAVGDTVKTKILKVKKSYAYGKALEILKPSLDRIENDCPSFLKCGGCAFRHISYQSEAVLKQKKVYECIKRIGGIDMPPKSIVTGKVSRYRNKAQFPVAQNGEVGFYAFHSHRIITCNDCDLQPEIFGIMAEKTSEWIRENNISIYDESTNTGLLRHIYIRIAEKTGEIMFTAVINGDTLPNAEKLVQKLKTVCGENLKSVQININRQDTNVILGEKCEVIYGEKYITDILCGVKVRLSPLSFYQVNRDMAEKLYEKAMEYASPVGKNILDLYCGAGTIGLSMANKAKSVIGVEIIPEAIEDAKFNAQNNGIENARFICSDATAAAQLLAKEGIKPDTVIVDPPRKGCSEDLIKTVANEFKPKTVVYVSCDPATLARDLKIFEQNGYKLLEYTPFDLFPRTSHVETVALLEKR